MTSVPSSRKCPPGRERHRKPPPRVRRALRRGALSRLVPCLAVPVLLAASPGPLAGQELAADKLYFPPCPAFEDEYAFDCYHDYAEVTAFLEAAAERHPELTTLESMGTSYQGRELWVLTITDPATGRPEEKPALWVDGGIDSDEVVATEAALGVVHRLLTSRDEPRIRELLRTRTFYVAPNVMPDASELHHRSPIRPRDTTLRPWDDDGDGRLDEDPPEDLDGDGQALRMRRRDPLGDWVLDEDDPRLLRERRAGDEGPFYALYLEGIDNDGDGRYQEDRHGGIDPNRNYPGNWSGEQGGSGPFAGSEAGIRAVYDFVLAHPNVAASQHFHSTGGVILRPPSVPDLELPGPDRELFVDLSRLGLEVTGYDLATSVYDWNWPPGSGNRKGSQVWRDAEGELPEEVRRNVEFALMQAEHTPLLRIGEVEVEDLSGGIYRITATIENVGYQPTELAVRREGERAVPVRALLEGGEVLVPEGRSHELGTLGGHDRAEASRVVRGSAGEGVEVRAWHPKAGRTWEEVVLP